MGEAVGFGYKRNPMDKLYWMGYNCSFDKDFMNKLFEKHSNKPLVQWTNFRTIDPLMKVYNLNFKYGLYSDLKNLRLETLCEYYDIEIDAHNSLSDAMATYNLNLKVGEEYVQNLNRTV